MTGLDDGFVKRFKELESGHVELRERLNKIRLRGDDLEQVLRREIEAYEPWRFELMDELGAISERFDPDQSARHLEFIKRSTYYRIVQEAPFYWQIMNKPNGYAGDAQMMSFIYRNQFEGQTPFGMFLHKHAVSTKACQAVRNRKLYLRQQLVDLGEGYVLSLAAGPAQEIKEILDIYPDNHYRFLALDHDMETLRKYDVSNHENRFKYALANAFQIIAGNYMTARPRKVFMNFCVPRRDFAGIRRVLAPLKYELDHMRKDSYDLVYSSGLYDYIKTFPLDDSKGTVALTKNLFDLVKPGGNLIVGNFSPNNPRDLRFPMDYIYEWHLIYRTKEEMLDFARAIPEGQIEDIEIVEEPLGINYFLRIKKKSWETKLPFPREALANFLM
ncbi:MAG: hypothetical protein DRH12_05190 [Deltaproteobacteria bacterium]|nr:MAG: hypothetical protein DRH12_05190 [Deltaproteobacteria bacterium]